MSNNITLSTDIYDIVSSVEEIKSQYLEEDEDTLAADIFGYLGAIESRKIQSSIMVASELSNELFPQRAKFKRNLISHAINLNIDDINAVPARMNFYLALRHDDLVDNLDENNSFIIDRNCVFMVAGFEFHPSYDVVIRRSVVKEEGTGNRKEVFSAQYIIEHEDPNANIYSPYLPSPITMVSNNETYVAVLLQFSQMTYDQEYTTIITNGIIENKMTTFSFIDQLAYFEVIVNDTDYVTPIFEGSAMPDGVDTFCYYTYMNDNTIRVKFDRTSYTPKLNDRIKINVYTTKGTGGNFKYKNGSVIPGNLESEKYGYYNIDYELHPLTDSVYGEDQKTKEQLRKIIPKEALMKGVVSTSDDLNNYFNMANTDDVVLRAQKKIDNQIERTFYTYFVMKDSEKNVVPTNTLDLYLCMEDLTYQELQDLHERFILPAGTVFGYDSTKDRMFVYNCDQCNNSIITEDDGNDLEEADESIVYEVSDSNYGDLDNPSNFVYISPFVISISTNPLYTQFYLTKINQDPYLNFKFINLNSPVSFIGTTAHWERLFYTKRDTYTLNVLLSQNINYDMGVVETTELIPEADEVVEAEEIDLYESSMNTLYYRHVEDPDYNSCYGRYFVSEYNLDVLNTGITARTPQNESEYMSVIDNDTIGRGKLESQTLYVYTAIKSNIGIYYPCKVGTINISVVCTEHYIMEDGKQLENQIPHSDPTKAQETVNMTLRTRINYYNTDNKIYKYKMYTATVKPLEHDPDKTHFLSTVFDGYMVYSREVDIIKDRGDNKGIDELFYSTLTEAVANTVRKSDSYFVYTRRHGDLLLLGTIKATQTDSSLGFYNYKWENYKCVVQDDSSNIFSNYLITHDKFDVWEYGENEYKYYNTLKQAVAAGEYDGKEKYYVYIKPTINREVVNHPVYLGEVIINSSIVSGNYYTATVDFIDERYMYKNTYDDYKDYYYLSDIRIISETNTDMYSKSLFDAILTQKPNSGLWYVYTHNTGETTPILMGTINLTRTDKDDKYACTYTWETEEEYEVKSHMKVLALFYKDNSPYRWYPLELDIKNSDVEHFAYNFTTDIRSLEYADVGSAFDSDNNIYIDNTYIPRTNKEMGRGYFNPTTDLELYVFVELKDENGNIVEYPYIGGLVNDYPGLNPISYFSENVVKGYTLCNIYRTSDGIHFYENYGNVMRSVVTPVESDIIEGETAGFRLTTIPVVGYRYSSNESYITEVIDAMTLRKAYIDNVLDELQNTIEIDFKFFNTFGPSKTFTLDQANGYIDRVNISLHFRVKLSEYNDEETVNRIRADVKDYIENLNYLESEHISILITQINKNYEAEIEYFDFIGFNDYGPEQLHIYRDPDDDIEIKTAPELLNVHNKFNQDSQKYEPDIQIEVIRTTY